MSENEKLERFGRYLILDHLVDGGMAKICRARFLGEQADKVVAIKMIQPQFSKDEAFKTMFMDEIKVTFGLNHPNIAATYDYGIIDDSLYTAMEYVEGRNLKEYLDKLVEKKLVFPVPISAYIVSQACLGLSYAHNFTDKLTGKEMNIIHRDISPHNIMLTFDGAIKVIDFGIAKAESNSEATQAGTIKGKLSYLAPEYLEYEGDNLDHRYDQFAVGITLWELLCRQKLFKAKTDLAVLKLIQECRIPKPSSINPNVPEELDEIVLKSLSKDRKSRFEDMNDLNRALVKFIYSNYPDFNPTNLEDFAKELFSEEISKDKSKMLEFGKIDIAPYLEDMKNDFQGNSNSMEKVSNDSSGGSVGGQQTSRTIRRELDMEFEEELESTEMLKLDIGRVRVSQPKKTQESKTQLTKINKPETKIRPSIKSSSNKSSINRNIKKTSVKNESQSSVLKYIIVASFLVYAYFEKDTITKFFPINDFISSEKIRNPASNSEKEKFIESTVNDKREVERESFKKGKLLIENFLIGRMEVFINNTKIENYNQFDGLELKINKNYNLRIERKGYLPFGQSFILTEENPESVIDVNPESKRWIKSSFGQLEASNYLFAKGSLVFEVNGNKIKKQLPINEAVDLPVGSYFAMIENGEIDRCVEFTIEEMKLSSLSSKNLKECLD